MDGLYSSSHWSGPRVAGTVRASTATGGAQRSAQPSAAQVIASMHSAGSPAHATRAHMSSFSGSGLVSFPSDDEQPAVPETSQPQLAPPAAPRLSAPVASSETAVAHRPSRDAPASQTVLDVLSHLQQEVSSIKSTQATLMQMLGELYLLQPLAAAVTELNDKVEAMSSALPAAVARAVASTSARPALMGVSSVGTPALTAASTPGASAATGMPSSDVQAIDDVGLDAEPLAEPIVGSSRIWVGTWNLGAEDPFEGVDVSRDHASVARILSPFIPKNADIYVLGVQEGINDSVYEAVRSYTGCFQLPLMCKLYPAKQSAGVRSRRMGRAIAAQALIDEFTAGHMPEPVQTQADMLDRVWGRGDGAFLTPKFTGIAVFVQPVIAPYVRLLGMYKHSFGASEGSKGGVGVGLGVYDSTIAFVNVHLASKRIDLRRQQYKDLVERLGAKLGGRGYALNEEFHHVVWMGDTNYHVSGVSAQEVLTALHANDTTRLLTEHDELLSDRESGQAFAGYLEPVMPPSFIPTYKKRARMGEPNWADPAWADKLYLTEFKEPFYKGGKVVDRVPSWTDRIQYHSLISTLGQLVPELLHPEDPDNSPHNYQAVHAPGLDVSDHAPVFATFQLNIKFDAEAQKWLDDIKQQEEDADDASSAAGPPRTMSMRSPSVRARGAQAQELGATDSKYAFGCSGPLIVAPAAHPALKPVSVILRVTDVQVDYKGVMRTPRAVSLLFPLPFEDSDDLPERAKVLRADKAGMGQAVSESLERMVATVQALVSKQSRIPTLHMLLKVSLDDNTKAQCVVNLGRGGFRGVGTHRHVYFTELTSSGVPLKQRAGRAVAVRFDVEMTCHYFQGDDRAAARLARSGAMSPAALTRLRTMSSLALAASRTVHSTGTPGEASPARSIDGPLAGAYSTDDAMDRARAAIGTPGRAFHHSQPAPDTLDSVDSRDRDGFASY